jgi:CBS domain containing-hemolysin-like protein
VLLLSSNTFFCVLFTSIVSTKKRAKVKEILEQNGKGEGGVIIVRQLL